MVVTNHGGNLLYLASKPDKCPFYIAELKAFDWASRYAATFAWNNILWFKDATYVVDDIKDSQEPQEWDPSSSILLVRHHFALFNWKLD